MTVFGIEARAFDEIEAAADHVARGECRPVYLASVGAAKGVAVVTVIAVGAFVPSRQSICVHFQTGKADTHVSVAAFGHDADFVIIKAARGWNAVVGSDRGRVFIGVFAFSFIYNF